VRRPQVEGEAHPGADRELARTLEQNPEDEDV